MNASRLLLLSIALSPGILLGQKREDLVSIQRDVAQLEDQVKQLQKALDDKMAALTALVQQSADQSMKTSTAISEMQRNVDQKLSDQGTKLVAPVATLGAKVDEMSTDFRSVRENVAGLVRRMNDMDAKIDDISNTMRTMAASAAPPPPAAALPTGGTAPQASDNPPPGMSADMSYKAALGDYNGKKDDIAIEEFANYLKYFPQSANAPSAQYYIGQIYYRAQDWPNAVKAFDAVLEKFPKNERTADAQYYKACALMDNHLPTAAGKEFASFIKAYPDSPKVAEAHKHLREMGLEIPKRRTTK
jgi:TolA-binding protein